MNIENIFNDIRTLMGNDKLSIYQNHVSNYNKLKFSVLKSSRCPPPLYEFTLTSYQEFAKLLSTPNNNIQKLNISTTTRSVRGEPLTILCNAITNENCELISLLIQSTELDFYEYNWVPKSNMFRIQILELPHNSLKDDEIKMISLLLTSEYNQILKLNLDYNEIGVHGMVYIANALKNKHNKLINLQMVKCGHNCSTVIEGVYAFYESLCHQNNKLQKLDLSGSRLTHTHLDILLKGLHDSNCKLINLKLLQNDTITKSLYNKWAYALKYNLFNIELLFLPLQSYYPKTTKDQIDYLCIRNRKAKLLLTLCGGNTLKHKYTKASIKKLPLELWKKLSTFIVVEELDF